MKVQKKNSSFKVLLSMILNDGGFIHLNGPRFLMEEDKGNGGGGGGPTVAELQKQIAETNKRMLQMQSENGRLKKQVNGGAKPGGKSGDDKNQSLLEKVRNNNNTDDKTKTDASELESAITFNLSAGDFVKNNKDILPNEAEKIIELANKENYDTAKSKSVAIKLGIVDSFFSIESNVELLTQSQKNQLADFQKMTKNGKEEKVLAIFENVFEPALEMIKRIKKAEEIAKGKGATASAVESGYKDRLMKSARKTHLKDKGE